MKAEDKLNKVSNKELADMMMSYLMSVKGNRAKFTKIAKSVKKELKLDNELENALEFRLCQSAMNDDRFIEYALYEALLIQDEKGDPLNLDLQVEVRTLHETWQGREYFVIRSMIYSPVLGGGVDIVQNHMTVCDGILMETEVLFLEGDCLTPKQPELRTVEELLHPFDGPLRPFFHLLEEPTYLAVKKEAERLGILEFPEKLYD